MQSTERVGFAVALALGVLVRFLPSLGAAGPTGDGGLILAMVDDIRDAGLTVPAVTSYNGLDIPFVYPPLALIAAAFVGEVAGASTLTLLSWIPLLLSIGTLAAFVWLAWRVLPPVAAIGAALVFALMPHAYDWVIAGGGLTRGAGLLAAIIAMAIAADRQPASVRTPVLAGISLGAAFLAHPQAAMFGVIGCLVLSWSAPIETWVRNAGIAAAAAIVVVVPWLIGVVGTHGIEALTSPANRLEPLVGLIRLGNLRFSGAPFMDVFAVLGAVGLVSATLRGPRRVPFILLLTYLVGPGGGEFLAAVPWALLSGIGIATLADLVVPMHRPARLASGAIVLFLALIGSIGSVADGSSKLHALSADHLEAMAWARDNLPLDAEVIVPTDDVWGDDELSEWFPALAERRSSGTVQGSEWLPAGGFEQQLIAHGTIRACAGATVTCYASIDPRAVLFIPKGRLAGPLSPLDCCQALRETVNADGYTILFDGPGATIALPND